MKKQSVLAMVMVLGLASSTSVSTQAAGVCGVNGNSQSKNCVVVKAQIKDLPEVKNALEDLYNRLQNGNGKDCPTIILPDCSQSGNGCQPNVPGCSQSGSECQPNVPDCSTPDKNQPETSGPDQGNCSGNVPNTEKPDNSQTGGNQPDNNQSGGNRPSSSQPGKPDTNKPDSGQPDSSVSSSETDNTEADTKEPEKDTLTFEEQVVKLVNEERAKAGLHALKIDTEVASAAAIRVKEIETSFSHTRPDGRKFSSVLTDNGIRYTGAGENIAWGQTSPEKVMEAWMNSEGHRANILNPKFTKIGVGHYQNASGRNYWSQLFTY